MRVFVTGASGHRISVVLSWSTCIHRVVGLARSSRRLGPSRRPGRHAHRGDLENLESLRSGAASATE